jgi:tetratricopeptide (TPR) repeat protein
VRQKAGDVAGAIEDYTTCISIDPDNAAWYFSRAAARQKAGDVVGAIEDLTESIAKDSKNPTLYVARGNVLSIAKRFPEAIQDYQSALKIKPDDEGVNATLLQAQKIAADAKK